MRLPRLFIALLLPLAIADGAQLFPMTDGTTWKYSATEEFGPSTMPAHSVIRCRVTGSEQFEGRTLTKLETFSNDVRFKTELVGADENGIRCFARSDKNGVVGPVSPPETIVPPTLKDGTSWNSEDEIANLDVHQNWVVVGSENVLVLAGNFHAYRFHSEQSSPTPIVCDRWFTPGTGFIKETLTMRSPTGDLLSRRTLELASKPMIVAGAKPADTQKFVAGVSSQPFGRFESEISSANASIYARWQGRGLRPRSKIRAVWIAENIGDAAPPDYKIDEASTLATRPDSHGSFTLSRPETGWTPGTYRVEFYINETLVQTVKLTIKK